MGLFDSTKQTIRTVTGKLFMLDDVIDVGVNSINKLRQKAHSDEYIIFRTAASILDKLEIRASMVGLYGGVSKRTKKWYQTSKHYGYLIAGDVLVNLGESTADDEIITAVVVSACVAVVSSMSGPAGGILANVVTTNTLKPILLGAFKYLDQAQIKVGNNLKKKANS